MRTAIGRPLRAGAGRLLVVALALAGLVADVGGPRPADASTSIKILVNNQPITSYDIAQRARLVRLSGASGNTTAEAERELINESLQMQEARRLGISVPESEVEQAITGIAQRIGISRGEFDRAIAGEGVSLDTLRDRIRAQIVWNRVVAARFRATRAVSEQDLVAALRERGGETSTQTTEYELEQLIVVVPNNASAGEKSAARNTAQNLRSRFTNCEQGLPFARDLQGVVVKPFGKRIASELNDDMRESLEDVPVGRLSAPLDRPEGLIMFAVCGKEEITSTVAAMGALQGELASERGERMAQQYLRTLRRDALIERR